MDLLNHVTGGLPSHHHNQKRPPNSYNSKKYLESRFDLSESENDLPSEDGHSNSANLDDSCGADSYEGNGGFHRTRSMSQMDLILTKIQEEDENDDDDVGVSGVSESMGEVDPVDAKIYQGYLQGDEDSGMDSGAKDQYSSLCHSLIYNAAQDQVRHNLAKEGVNIDALLAAAAAAVAPRQNHEYSNYSQGLLPHPSLAAVVQGDYASNHSGVCPSEPPESSIGPNEDRVSHQKVAVERGSLGPGPGGGGHENEQVVKQLVMNQIDKKLKDLRTLKQHYYPEGGWGYVITLMTMLVQILSHGLQLGLGIYMNYAAHGAVSSGRDRDHSASGYLGAFHRRFNQNSMMILVRRLLFQNGVDGDASWLGAMSLSLSLFASPLIVGVCRRKSTRLTAVMGGLVAALGCLFTSFASQFHQLFLSYGVMMAIGVGMVRDPATLMLGQYFKRKRELMEIFLVGGSGAGIAVMSMVVHIFMRSIGWRLGLQALAGLVFLTFFLGTFYRSASLYHPQRRAILHLKSQKRKIKSKDKEKNKAQDDRPPFFDFATLKSRTVQILLISIALGSFGLYAPVLYLTQQASRGGVVGDDLMWLQVYLGSAWLIGCTVFGLVVVNKSRECSISKQYLCQVSLLICGLTLAVFPGVRGYNGYVTFVWVYGLFLGGYNYSLKLYIYEKVRARNFARAWSFAQCAMSIPNFIGVPVAGYLNSSVTGGGGMSGFYFSSAFIVLGAAFMSLIDVHRRRLRNRRRKHRRHTAQHRSQKSIASTMLSHQGSSGGGGTGSNSGNTGIPTVQTLVSNGAAVVNSSSKNGDKDQFASSVSEGGDGSVASAGGGPPQKATTPLFGANQQHDLLLQAHSFAVGGGAAGAIAAAAVELSSPSVSQVAHGHSLASLSGVGLPSTSGSYRGDGHSGTYGGGGRDILADLEHRLSLCSESDSYAQPYSNQGFRSLNLDILFENLPLVNSELSGGSHHSHRSNRSGVAGLSGSIGALGGVGLEEFDEDLAIEASIFSEEGIADMDLPEHFFIQDLEFLDNITSCDKVENCVMLSEYEQNLIKETESPATTRKFGPRKWSIFGGGHGNNSNPAHQGTKSDDGGATAGGASSSKDSSGKINIGIGGLRQQNSITSSIMERRRSGRQLSALFRRDGHHQDGEGGAVGRSGSSRRPKRPSTKRDITVIEEASV